MRRSYLLLALATIACGQGDDDGDDQICTARGCDPTHVMLLDLGGTLAELPPLVFEACFNDHCETGPIDGSLLPDGGPFWVFTYVPCGETCELDVSWIVHAETRVGDQYRITVRSEDGTTVAELVEVAETYGQTFPNGEACEPVCPLVTSVETP